MCIKFIRTTWAEKKNCKSETENKTNGKNNVYMKKNTGVRPTELIL